MIAYLKVASGHSLSGNESHVRSCRHTRYLIAVPKNNIENVHFCTSAFSFYTELVKGFLRCIIAALIGFYPFVFVM